MFKPKNISNIIGGGLLAAGLLLAGVTPTHAEVIITATETGGDVVFEASGSLDVDSWVYQTSFPGSPYISPSALAVVIGPEGNPQVDNYIVDLGTNYKNPPPFGAGFNTFSDSGSGDIFGIDRNQLQVPAGYTSGDQLSGTSTYAGQTFNSLGMEFGSYTWTWGGQGQEDSMTLIVVDSGLTVDFAADVTSGTAPLTVQFTNLSSGATTYAWDFGDTATSTDENPSHTYSTAGTYTVSLTATGDAGTNSSTKPDYIVVDGAPEPPMLDVQQNSGIAVTGIVGQHYQVEWQDALVPESPWQLLDVIHSLPSSPYLVYDPTPISPTTQRNYRVVWVP